MIATDDLIERFPEINPGNYGEDDAIALNNWGIDAVAALVQLRERVAELEAENDALRADALRYRWLRVNPVWIGWNEDYLPEHIDKATDDAIAARKEKP